MFFSATHQKISGPLEDDFKPCPLFKIRLILHVSKQKVRKLLFSRSQQTNSQGRVALLTQGLSPGQKPLALLHWGDLKRRYLSRASGDFCHKLRDINKDQLWTPFGLPHKTYCTGRSVWRYLFEFLSFASPNIWQPKNQHVLGKSGSKRMLASWLRLAWDTLPQAGNPGPQPVWGN